MDESRDAPPDDRPDDRPDEPRHHEPRSGRPRSDDAPSGAPGDSAREPTAAVDGEPVYPVAHDALTRPHLPGPRDPFEDVIRFAYTFDGYAHFGMEMCAGIGNRAVSHFLQLKALPAWIEGDLDRLRGALYFEARRWILLEREPDARILLYIHALIDGVRDALDGRGAR